MIHVNIKQIEGLELPQNAHNTDAGYDVYAVSEPNIKGDSVDLGIKVPALDKPFGGKKDMWKRVDYIEYKTNLFVEIEGEELESINLVDESNLVEMDFEKIFHILLHPRSSIRKYNLSLANSIGLVDHSYRGELIFSYNYNFQPEDLQLVDGKFYGKINKERIYKKGDKIGQLVFEPTVKANFKFVDELGETVRGKGGHGSTGK